MGVDNGECQDAAWVAVGASVRGSAHVRVGIPNQDAVGWAVTGTVATIVAADGHGGARHSRSEVGSRLAVSAAVDSLSGVDLASVASEGELVARLRADVVPGLVRRWRRSVESDAVASGSRPGSEVAPPWDLYGTTLLAAAVWGRWLVTMQLGDGDIVVVESAQGCTYVPHPYRHASVSTETESLCMPDADARFGISCRDLDERPVLLVFAATDGFGGAIEDRGWHLPVGRELAQHFDSGGVEEIERRLPGWLEAPADVAGDDASMCLLMRNPP